MQCAKQTNHSSVPSFFNTHQAAPLETQSEVFSKSTNAEKKSILLVKYVFYDSGICSSISWYEIKLNLIWSVKFSG